MHEIKLASGQRFSLEAPAADRLGFPDMLHHLALQPARAGATIRPLFMTHRAAMLSELAERAAKEEWDGWQAERSPHWRLVHQTALYAFLWHDAAALLGDPALPPDAAMQRFRMAFARARCERYRLPWTPPADIVRIIEECDLVIDAMIDRDLGTGATEYGDFPLELRTPDAERAQRIYVRRFGRLINPTPERAAYWLADRESAEQWLKTRNTAEYDVWGVPTSSGVTLPIHREAKEKLGDWLIRNILRRRRPQAAAQ